MSESELFKILSYERTKLLDYLTINGSYDNLKNALVEIENNNPDKLNIIQQLFLGKHGLECNKQLAFYELPTHELINGISYICEQLGIFKIEEIGAGIGLLSGLLSRMTNLDITCTDGKLWMETSSMIYPVQQKLFLEYAMDNTNYDDKLIILSWVPNKGVDDISEMVKLKKFRQMLVIGEQYNKYIIDTDNMMNENGYKKVNIIMKQLCYNDYFKMNTYYADNCIRSSCTLYIRNEVETINIPNQDITVVSNISDFMVIQDMIVFGLLPKWIKDVMLDYDLNVVKKTIIDIEKATASRSSNELLIFNIIDNLEYFNFWKTKRNFPKIKTKEKFTEYYELCKALNHQNGLNNLKQRLCIPNWINNKDEAEKYLYLEFSVDSKKWKESRDTFISYYMTNMNLNHYMAGSIFGF